MNIKAWQANLTEVSLELEKDGASKHKLDQVIAEMKLAIQDNQQTESTNMFHRNKVYQYFSGIFVENPATGDAASDLLQFCEGASVTDANIVLGMYMAVEEHISRQIHEMESWKIKMTELRSRL